MKIKGDDAWISLYMHILRAEGGSSPLVYNSHVDGTSTNDAFFLSSRRIPSESFAIHNGMNIGFADEIVEGSLMARRKDNRHAHAIQNVNHIRAIFGIGRRRAETQEAESKFD